MSYNIRYRIGKHLIRLNKDSIIIEFFSEVIQDENIDVVLREAFVETFLMLDNINNKIIKVIIQFIQNKPIYKWDRRKINRVWDYNGDFSDIFEKKMLNTLKENKIDKRIIESLIVYFVHIIYKSNEKEIIKTLKDVIHYNIDYKIKKYLEIFLFNYLNDDKRLNDILEGFQTYDEIERGTAYHHSVLPLKNIVREDDKFIETLINWLNDGEIIDFYKEDIAEKLVSLGKNNKLISSYLPIYINSEDPNIKKENTIFSEKNQLVEDYISCSRKYYPIYIEKNRLCTVKDGEKIIGEYKVNYFTYLKLFYIKHTIIFRHIPKLRESYIYKKWIY